MKPSPLDTTTPFGGRMAGRAASWVWWLATLPLRATWKRRLRKRARGHPGPFDVAVDLPGQDVADIGTLRFRTYPAENYCDRILFGKRKLPELEEHRALLPYLKPGMTFVDIGANVGAYSVFVGSWARLFGRDGDSRARILAFEPHPRTVEKLRFNLAANGIPVEIVQAAVGPEPGCMQLWSDGGGNIGQTSLLPEATSNAKVAVEVEIVPLAEALGQRGISHIDLLKIDVEGFEDRALSPFFAVSPEATWPRAILLESEHSELWEDDLLARMARCGYSQVFQSGQNGLYVRE